MSEASLSLRLLESFRSLCISVFLVVTIRFVRLSLSFYLDPYPFVLGFYPSLSLHSLLLSR